MNSLEYASYLASDYWQERRKRALYLAQHRCQSPLCALGYLRSLSDQELRGMRRDTYRLDAHHLTYDRLGSECDDDLIVLCQACHREQHGIVEPTQPTGPRPIVGAVIQAIQRMVQESGE